MSKEKQRRKQTKKMIRARRQPLSVIFMLRNEGKLRNGLDLGGWAGAERKKK